VLALTLLIAGCKNPMETGIPGACPLMDFFGGTGCLEVAGRVVGMRGQSLGNMQVQLRALSGPSAFDWTYQETDTSGQFRLRLSRMSGKPPSDGRPDTVSIYTVAYDPLTAGVGVPLVCATVFSPS
jgi:hypothetical protein